MSTQVYGAHGHAFTVHATDPALDARIQRVFATLRLHDPVGTCAYLITTEAANAWTLRFDAEVVGTRPTADGALLLLHWHINQRVIERATQRRTTFHAAAACSPGGTGVLLAAPMESGKTTTVTGLLRAGWRYLTDEAVACDPDGVLHAYAKPLTLDRGSWPLFPELGPPDTGAGAHSWLIPAPSTGAAVVAEARLGLIIFPRHVAGGATRATPLPPSQAAWSLAQSTFAFSRYGARDLHTVAALARRSLAIQLDVGDLAQAVDLVIDLESSLDVAA